MEFKAPPEIRASVIIETTPLMLALVALLVADQCLNHLPKCVLPQCLPKYSLK
jgi:hypothetical protein